MIFLNMNHFFSCKICIFNNSLNFRFKNNIIYILGKFFNTFFGSLILSLNFVANELYWLLFLLIILIGCIDAAGFFKYL